MPRYENKHVVYGVVNRRTGKLYTESLTASKDIAERWKSRCNDGYLDVIKFLELPDDAMVDER